MTIKEALQGSALPSADAEVLLSHAINRDRTWLLAHGDDPLAGDQWTRFMQWVERRRRHEPVAYIVGEQEFYGRPFTVDHRVLIPRPATEGVVRRALEFLEDGEEGVDEVDEGIVVVARKLKIDPSASASGEKLKINKVVDVGTGSGCIGISLALERPDLHVIVTDISGDALEVAKLNAKRHSVLNRMEFREGSGLDPIQDLAEPFLLVSNPPYIPSGNDLMADVKNFEPHVALFGGTSGHRIVEDLQKESAENPFCAGWVMEYGKKK